MSRLTTIRPLATPLPPRIGYAPGDEQGRDKQRRDGQAWRAWYRTSEWQKLRWRALVRDMFTCQMCGRIEAQTSKLVGDHKIPHRGDRAKFFDEQNVWCICKPCHDGQKQRMEKRQGLR